MLEGRESVLTATVFADTTARKRLNQILSLPVLQTSMVEHCPPSVVRTRLTERYS